MPSHPHSDAFVDLVRQIALPGTSRVVVPDADLMPLVRRHRLGPLAYRRGLEAARDDYAASALLCRRRAQVVENAVAALEKANIAVALLKGISYAASLYDAPGERQMTDVDLLVPRTQFAAAITALERAGFRATATPPLHHATTLVRGEACIDLHHDIERWTGGRVDVGAALDRAAPAVERTDTALRLDDVDELLFHAVHLGRTHFVAPLIAYVDAARLLARLSDARFHDLMSRARRYRIARVVGATLVLTRRVTGVGPSEPAPNAAAPRLDELISGRPLPWRRRAAQRALLSDDPRALVVAGVGHVVRRLSALGRR